MVDKGNVDKHRRTYSNGVKAVEEMKWGADKARERYGAPKQVDLTVKGDPTAPQKLGDKNNLRGPGYNDHKDDWVRGRGESAENMPNYLPGYRKKR
jgi:hypothetical protein